MKIKKTALLAAALVVAASASPVLAERPAEHRVPAKAERSAHRPPPLGIEKALMDAELARLMAARTGLAAEELQARFEQQRPPQVAAALGLQPDDMCQMHREALVELQLRLQLSDEHLAPKHRRRACRSAAPRAGSRS